jgi:hypothetical protein
MKKTLLLLCSTFALSNVFSQGWVGNSASNKIFTVNSALSSNPLNIGIGTASPTEQLHTTAGVRFEGLTADPLLTKLVVQSSTGKLFYQDANFWRLDGNPIVAGNFLGSTTNVDLVFKRFNVRSGLLSNDNTSFGVAALNVSTTGSGNVAFGTTSLLSNTSGYGNTAIGQTTMSQNTTGSLNVSVGRYSMYYSTTGSSNTATGSYSLYNNLSGNNNAATGYGSLQSNTTGSQNTANGMYSLQFNTAGSNNSGFGYNSLQNCVNGNNNSAVGLASLQYIVSGNNNTAIGYNTGLGVTTGNSNTIIGANVGASSFLPSNLSHTIIIADGDGNQRIYVDAHGYAGLATTVPTAALHIDCTGVPLSSPSNVRFENLQRGEGNVVVIDNDGYLFRSSSTAKPASQDEVEQLKKEVEELKSQVKLLMDAQKQSISVK